MIAIRSRRSYNKLLKMMSDIGLQYFTCDESNASSSSLLEAMADQQRAAFMRQDSFVAQCLEDPWFIEYFGNDLASGNLNRSLNQELLIRFPRKMHPGRPHADSQVRQFSITLE